MFLPLGVVIGYFTIIFKLNTQNLFYLMTICHIVYLSDRDNICECGKLKTHDIFVYVYVIKIMKSEHAHFTCRIIFYNLKLNY